MICCFTVHGDVVPWARAGARGKVHFTPARQRSFMGVLRSAAMDAMRGAPPVDDPVELRIIAYYMPPKSRTRAERAHPGAGFKKSAPDVDNITKIIKDSLKKIVWVDDARVASLHVAKVFDARPRLVVAVEPLSWASWPFRRTPAAPAGLFAEEAA